jgi:branched-chain amino acid transport system substrate-binding protein
VLGRKLELLTEDNQSKQGESKTIARKLISRDGVIAMLGEVASGRSIEAAYVCQLEKIPQIAPSSTNPKVTQIGDFIFRICFTDPQQGKVLARFAEQTLHAKRVAGYFKETFTADGGQVLLEEKYTGGDKDFKAQLTALKATQPDVLFVPGYYTEAGLIARQARELGLNVPIFGGDGWESPELVTIGGDAVEGTYFSTHFSPEEKSPAIEKFVKNFQARYNTMPNAFAALGYDSAMILADAIQRAGSTDGAKVRDALAATQHFPGITGDITINAHRDASKPLVMLKVKNGQFSLVERINPE